jgi:hypothetical protein
MEHADYRLADAHLSLLGDVSKKLADSYNQHNHTFVAAQSIELLDRLLAWPAAKLNNPLNLISAGRDRAGSCVVVPFLPLLFVVLLACVQNKSSPIITNHYQSISHETAVCHRALAEVLSKDETNQKPFIHRLLATAERVPDDKATTAVLLLRALCNCFVHMQTSLSDDATVELALDVVASLRQRFEGDAAVALACVGVCINFALLFASDAQRFEQGKVQVRKRNDAHTLFFSSRNY